MKRYKGTVIMNTYIDGEGLLLVMPVRGDSTMEMLQEAMDEVDDDEFLEMGIYDMEEESPMIMVDNKKLKAVNPEDIIEIIKRHTDNMEAEIRRYVEQLNEDDKVREL